MPLITLNKNVCYYEFEDFGYDKVLIFSNSLGTNLSMWEAQLVFLSPHFNILRYDTRGHGKSGVGAATTDIATLGNDVLALLDYLKLDKVHFCGLSMGGLIGQWLGINAPKRFEKIIISNTAAKIGNAEGWNQRIAQVRANGLKSITEGTAERWFTPNFRIKHPSVIEGILNNFVQTDTVGYMASCGAVRDADFRTELRKLEVPTLVISGSEDPVTTVEDAKFMTQRIPKARHITLNAAHLSNVEVAEAFSKCILSSIS